jgi:ribosomal protein L12E/L44/L45/RPP1/RPP2
MNEELFGLLGINPESAKEKAFTRGLLGAIAQAAALSGPQARPVGNLQGLGQIGLAGLGGYESAMDKTLADALKGVQLKQAIEQQQRQQAFRTAAQGAITRQPTVQDVLRQQTNIEPQALEGMSMQEVIAQAPKSGVAVNRDRLLSAIAEFAPEKYLELTQSKATDLPSSVREYEYARGQGFKGTFQDFITEQKKAGAPSTTITLPGDKKMAEVLGAKGAERLDTSLTQAQEAQSTIQNINELRPILAEGVFAGPLSAAPRAVAQIASSLGVTGKDTKELLERTAVAMQGLAKFELSAAAAMRGQGAITENERMLIQRAAGGRLDQFTAPEVQALLTAMEKTANYRIGSHNRQLDVLRRSGSPEVRDLVPFYELGPMNVAPVQTAPTGGVRKFNPNTGRIQ